MEKKAKRLATQLHKGEYRKDGKTPYIKHPKAVVDLLKSIGVKDEDILCAAWLHDVIENCGVTKEFLEKEFNSNISRIVAVLTKDVDKEIYNERIKNSDYAVKIIKLADTVHNCSEMGKSGQDELIKRKIKDCKTLYLDMAEEISPKFYSLLLKYIKPYLKKS